MAGRERRQSEREREKGKGETIKDEGDETRRNMTQVMYRKTGSLDRRERRVKGKKGMPPRVNLAYTGVAKHKFPFGDLCLSGVVAFAKRLCVGYYLSAGTAFADEHAAPFVLDRRIVPRPRRFPKENASHPPDIDAPQLGSE